MTATEKKIVELRLQLARKQTEMMMAWWYNDPKRCFEAQKQMEFYRKRIKRVKKNGVRKPSKIKEWQFVKELNEKYGYCPDVMKGV